MTEILEAALLALVQGLTEFLPISSSGHLIVLRDWIGLAEGDRGAAFDVVLHLGSLCAVILTFRRVLWAIVRDSCGALKQRPAADSPQQENALLGWYMICATIPFVIAGLIFGESAKNLLRSVYVTAWASIGFGLLLLAADLLGSKRRSLKALNWASSTFIGLTQILAMVPARLAPGTMARVWVRPLQVDEAQLTASSERRTLPRRAAARRRRPMPLRAHACT